MRVFSLAPQCSGGSVTVAVTHRMESPWVTTSSLPDSIEIVSRGRRGQLSSCIQPAMCIAGNRRTGCRGRELNNSRHLVLVCCAKPRPLEAPGNGGWPRHAAGRHIWLVASPHQSWDVVAYLLAASSGCSPIFGLFRSINFNTSPEP